MGEETINPKRTVPVAMFWSIIVNALMGLFSLMTWLVSRDPPCSLAKCVEEIPLTLSQVIMPPVQDMVVAVHPFYYMLWTSLHSPALFLVVTLLFLAGSFACGLSVYASSSRLTWAWARDGGSECSSPYFIPLLEFASVRLRMRQFCHTEPAY